MKIRTILYGIAAVFGLSALNGSMYVIDQKEQAIVTQFGNPVKVILNPVSATEQERKANNKKTTEEIYAFCAKEHMPVPSIDDGGAGLKFKLPFIQKVVRYDRRISPWDGYPEQINTKDKKYVWNDLTGRFIIQNPLIYSMKISTEDRAYGRLDEIIDGTSRNVITNENLIEIVRSSNRAMYAIERELKEAVQVDSIKEGRDQIMQTIHSDVQSAMAEYGIGIQDIRIKTVIYVDEVKKAVEGRMQSERQNIAAKYRSEGNGEMQRIQGEKNKKVAEIESEAYKKAEDIKGAADAEATKIYAQIYGKDPELYNFMRSLEAYRNLPAETKVVVSPESPLFHYLTGPGKK
jgi:modulator of FtsH protease HflC